MQYVACKTPAQDEDSLKSIVKKKYLQLKALSGSHSPSSLSLQKAIPEINLKIDCCYLSNPYATEVFMKRLKSDFANDAWLHDMIESYPAQNRQVAVDLSHAIGVKPANIFVGNGATEIISGVLTNFVKGKILIMLPTFSPYYEYVNTKTTSIHFYPMMKEHDHFRLDKEHLISYCKNNTINNIVFINPNNPDGSFILYDEMYEILERLSFMDNIILDESFIDFAQGESMTKSFYKFNNLIIIKSMSKDFGIAGIRCGYALMKDTYVDYLLETGFLWNSSCFSIYFVQLLSDPNFVSEYMVAKEKFYLILKDFEKQLMTCNPRLLFYKSNANFFLGELLDPEDNIEDFMLHLLVEFGVYIRMCSDKKGLGNRFFRVSCRTEEDNVLILKALASWKKDIPFNPKSIPTVQPISE